MWSVMCYILEYTLARTSLLWSSYWPKDRSEPQLLYINIPQSMGVSLYHVSVAWIGICVIHVSHWTCILRQFDLFKLPFVYGNVLKQAEAQQVSMPPRGSCHLFEKSALSSANCESETHSHPVVETRMQTWNSMSLISAASCTPPQTAANRQQITDSTQGTLTRG